MEKAEQNIQEGYHLISRKTLLQLVKTNCKLSNMLILLTYICEVQNVQLTLTAEEICEVLKIKPKTLEECRKKKWIKSWSAGQYTYYKAYDIAALAERINRRRILRRLALLPYVNK